MRVRVDEAGEHPAAGVLVKHLHVDVHGQTLAQRGDGSVGDQDVAHIVDSQSRVEEMDSGKEETFGG